MRSTSILCRVSATAAPPQARQEALHLPLGALHVHQLSPGRYMAPLSLPGGRDDLPFALGLELCCFQECPSGTAGDAALSASSNDGVLSLQYILDGSAQVTSFMTQTLICCIPARRVALHVSMQTDWCATSRLGLGSSSMPATVCSRAAVTGWCQRQLPQSADLPNTQLGLRQAWTGSGTWCHSGCWWLTSRPRPGLVSRVSWAAFTPLMSCTAYVC